MFINWEVWKHIGDGAVKVYTGGGWVTSVVLWAVSLFTLVLLCIFCYEVYIKGKGVVKGLTYLLLFAFVCQACVYGLGLDSYGKSQLKAEALVQVKERTGNPDLEYLTGTYTDGAYLVGSGDDVYKVELTDGYVEYKKMDDIIKLKK